jgi:hypothetical protein
MSDSKQPASFSPHWLLRLRLGRHAKRFGAKVGFYPMDHEHMRWGVVKKTKTGDYIGFLFDWEPGQPIAVGEPLPLIFTTSTLELKETLEKAKKAAEKPHNMAAFWRIVDSAIGR